MAVFLKDCRCLVLSDLLGAAALALLIGNIRDMRHGWRGRGEGGSADEGSRDGAAAVEES